MLQQQAVFYMVAKFSLPHFLATLSETCQNGASSFHLNVCKGHQS